MRKDLSISWDLDFCIANLLFKSKACLEVSLFSLLKQEHTMGANFTPEKFDNVACEVCKFLLGEYKKKKGRRQNVQGDPVKVQRVSNSFECTWRIFKRVDVGTHIVEDTNEVRTLMNYDSRVFWIAFDVSVFVSLSPEENNKLLLLHGIRLLWICLVQNF